MRVVGDRQFVSKGGITRTGREGKQHLYGSKRMLLQAQRTRKRDARIWTRTPDARIWTRTPDARIWTRTPDARRMTGEGKMRLDPRGTPAKLRDPSHRHAFPR
jgi:hypothetical protein